MSSEDNKKQLKKRSLPITKTYRPPYTSLRQPTGEQIQLSTEPFKEWRQSQYSSLEDYIKAELKNKGITSEMLLANPILRKQVTEWKKNAYTELNKSLSQAEKEALQQAGVKTEITEGTPTQLSQIKEGITQARQQEITQTVNTLVSKGIIKMDGDNLTLIKPPSTQEEANKLSTIGINVGVPTDKYTPKEIEAQNKKFEQALKLGKINQKQYNQVMYQQNLNLKKTYDKYKKEGLIKKEPGADIYTIAENYYTYSPSEQRKLNEIFDIPSNIQKTANLVSSGVIKLEGNNLVQNKPWTEMTKSDISNMENLGFETPTWAAVSFYKNLKEDLPGQVTAGLLTTSNQVAVDVTGALNWITKDADIFNLIPDTDIKLDVPTFENLEQWTRIDDPSILVAANISLGIAEGFATDAIFSKALSVAGKALGTAGKFTVSKTGISKIASKLASSKKYTNIVSKIPSFTYGKTTATNVAKWLIKHPKITSLLISAPAAGMSVSSALRQLSAGVDPHDVYMQLGKNIGLIAGGTLYNVEAISKLSRKDQLALKRATNIKLVKDSNGKLKMVLSAETKRLKGLSPAAKELITTQFDPQTGEHIVLVGVGSGTGNVPTTMALEMTNQMWDDLLKTGEVTLDIADDFMKAALIDSMGAENYGILVTNGHNLDYMTATEVAEAMTKELGEGSPYLGAEAALKNKAFIVTGEGSLKIVGAYTPDTIRQLNTSLGTLYDDLISAGIKPKDVSKWSTTILTENSEKLALAAHKAGLNANTITKLLKIKVTYSPVAEINLASQTLKSIGLNKSQVKSVINASSASFSSSETFTNALANLDKNTLSKTVQLVKPKTVAAALEKMSPKLLTKVIEVSDPAKLTSFIKPTSLTSILNTVATEKTIEVIAPNLSTEQITSILPGIKQNTLNVVIPNLTNKQLKQTVPNLSAEVITKISPILNTKSLDNITPFLSTNQLTKIFTALSPKQVNIVIPKLSPDQFDSVIQDLGITPKIIQTYLQTGQTSTIQNIPPAILKGLLKEHIKRNKKTEKKKETTFEVNLSHYMNSEKFKIKAKTFKEASVVALQRSKIKQVPFRVTVRQTK